VWHSNSKYKRTVWQCNAKFKGESRCSTPHLYEQRIKALFFEAFVILMEDRETVIADCSCIDREAEEISNEMEVVAGMIQRLVDENATRKLDQEDYRRKYAGYADRYAALESRMDGLKKERELPMDFIEKLFHRLVDFAMVYSDGRVVFTFRNGAEVSIEI